MPSVGSRLLDIFTLADITGHISSVLLLCRTSIEVDMDQPTNHEVDTSTSGQVVSHQESDELAGSADVKVTVSEAEPLSPTSPLSDGTPVSNEKRASLSLPVLRVEQLKEEGCSSPGSSAYNSEDSEFSDTDVISRLGEFAPPSEELAQKIAEQVRA